MKKKYNAPLAEILELEIDETVCSNDMSEMINNGSNDTDVDGDSQIFN